MIITSLGHDGIEIILMYKWENRGWNVAIVMRGSQSMEATLAWVQILSLSGDHGWVCALLYSVCF